MLDLKNRRGGAPFAFIEFEDPRDAEDAILAKDGTIFDGYRIRVESPRGTERGRGGVPLFGKDARGGDRNGGRYDRDSQYGGRRGGGGGGRGPPPGQRTGYRVSVSGLPPTGSWQDLKDHFREVGDVIYTDVFRDGMGVVEFSRRDSIRTAVKHLDDSKFRSHEGESSYIRVKEDSARGSRSRSRSPVGRGGRSPPPPPRGGRSRSRSRSPRRTFRSRSPSKDKGRMRRSRSRSRS